MVLDGVRDVTGALVKITDMFNVMCNIGNISISFRPDENVNVASLQLQITLA